MRNAIVTGASNGIGKAIAIRLAKLGVNLVVNYYSDDDAAKAVAEEAESFGITTCLVKSDVGTDGGRKLVLEKALKCFNHIDILINNAGVFFQNDIFSITEKDFSRTLDVIIKGSFFLTQDVVKHMVEKKVKGRIINISSSAVESFEGIPTDYSIAKAGINMMTRTAAKDIGKYGITCNAIMPGAIPTKLNKWQFDVPEIKERLRNGSVLREFGDANFIAKAVEYFVSDEAAWTTGAILKVDGGYTL